MIAYAFPRFRRNLSCLCYSSVRLRLPAPLAGLVLGREWFAERGVEPSGRLVDDVFTAAVPT